ncbi:MAG: hypothetical protein ABW136_02910 [Steroidobacteraceae bacterium]
MTRFVAAVVFAAILLVSQALGLHFHESADHPHQGQGHEYGLAHEHDAAGSHDLGAELRLGHDAIPAAADPGDRDVDRSSAVLPAPLKVFPLLCALVLALWIFAAPPSRIVSLPVPRRPPKGRPLPWVIPPARGPPALH